MANTKKIIETIAAHESLPSSLYYGVKGYIEKHKPVTVSTLKSYSQQNPDLANKKPMAFEHVYADKSLDGSDQIQNENNDTDVFDNIDDKEE